MSEYFQAFILGTWSNKSQAQSNPTGFRQVTLHWTRKPGRGLGLYHAAYHYRDEPDPYLEVQKKLVIVSDVEVVLEHHGGTYTNWKRLDNCDMRLGWDGTKWTGSFDSKIDQDGEETNVHAELHLYGNKLFTKDKSTDSEGNVLWGDDGTYKFVRVT